MLDCVRPCPVVADADGSMDFLLEAGEDIQLSVFAPVADLLNL